MVPAPAWLITARARGSTVAWSTQEATSTPVRSPSRPGSAEPTDSRTRQPVCRAAATAAVTVGTNIGMPGISLPKVT